MPTSQREAPKKLFTRQSANAMLPLVRAITQDLVTLARDVVERRKRLPRAPGGRDVKAKDVYAQEVAQIEEALEEDARRLVEYVEELRQLGVEPKGAVEGLIDFPAEVDGEPAWLCWRLGEPEVGHWHPLEAGFAGRRPLP